MWATLTISWLHSLSRSHLHSVVVEIFLQNGYRRSLENCNSRDLQDLQSHCRAPQTAIVFVFAILCIMSEGDLQWDCRVFVISLIFSLMSVFACIYANFQSLNPSCKNLANPWSHVVNLLLEDFGSDLCSAIYLPFFCKAIWDVSVWESKSSKYLMWNLHWCLSTFIVAAILWKLLVSCHQYCGLNFLSSYNVCGCRHWKGSCVKWLPETPNSNCSKLKEEFFRSTEMDTITDHCWALESALLACSWKCLRFYCWHSCFQSVSSSSAFWSVQEMEWVALIKKIWYKSGVLLDMRFTVNCHKVFDEILCLMTLDKVTLSIQWAKTLRHMRAQITYFQRQSKSGCEQVIHFRPPLDGKLMVQFSCRLELKEMLEWIYWAMAAYKKDSQSLATFLKVKLRISVVWFLFVNFLTGLYLHELVWFMQGSHPHSSVTSAFVSILFPKKLGLCLYIRVATSSRNLPSRYVGLCMVDYTC